MMRYLLGLCALLLLGISHAQTPKAPANFTVSALPINLSVTGLHVSGNRILNGAGQAVSLRGVNKDGAEYECLGATSTTVFDGPVDQNDVSNMLAWSVNLVRIPVNEQCWLGINGLPITANYNAAAYRTGIVNYVNLLSANNIASIIDLQWAAPGTHQAFPSPQALIPMPDADHAPAFWTSVANTFKSNSSVIFDLFNEPFPDNNQDTSAAWGCLRDGCTSIYPNDSSNYTSVGMQSLVNTIRATGSTNIIMSPGVQFTNVMTQWLTFKPTDTAGNLIAEWHSYQGQVCSTQACWDANIAPILATTPLITGEFGENDCQDIYVDPLMTYLDARYGNYVAWAWNTYDCASFPAVISDYPTATPTSFGIDIRNHYLAMAGRKIPAPPVVSFFTTTYPFGIAVGRNTNYTAGDGTIYYADTPATGLVINSQFFTPFSTADTITGTSDPSLYQTGKVGNFGTWTVNVPNGNYTVTLGLAYNNQYGLTGTTVPLDVWGQDQTIQGQQVGTCIFTSYSGTNPYMDFTGGVTGGSGYTNGIYTNVSLTGGSGTGAKATIYVAGGIVTTVVTTTQGTGYAVGNVLSGSVLGGTGFSATVQGISACLAATSSFVPVVDTAYTVSYTVSVFNQQLSIQTAQSFGPPRQTILNSIKIAQQSVAAIPAKPVGLTATPGNLIVNLSWTATSGATSYNVYRSLAAQGFYRQVATATTNSYADTAVTNGKTYYYLISAANSAGTSAKTASVNATPSLVPPSAPTGVGAAGGNAQVVVSWSSSVSATSYNVKRSTTNGSGYVTVGSPTASPLTNTGLANGTTYFYVVTAVNGAGESGNSLQVSATPQSSGTTGVWTNVTPAGVDTSNFGTQTVGADPANPGTMYVAFDGLGIWKSTDYGQTWAGPINTGTLGSTVGADGGSGITVGSGGVVYFACIRGPQIGFFKSTNGGVDWTNYPTPLKSGSLGSHGTEEDIYYPQIDPYNANHLIMTAHEQPFLFESLDGGHTWSNIPLNGTQSSASGGTAFAYFVNTGVAGTAGTPGSGGTANTWLWIEQGTGGTIGTWRTTNAGGSWTQVSTNEHNHGTSSIYQPNTTGDVFMSGVYAAQGWGVMHSTDYGVTWASSTSANFGNTGQNVIIGTSKFIYSNNGAALAVGSNFIQAPVPGTSGTWTAPSSYPNASWPWGAGQFVVVNDGSHNILLAANWVGGVWRYIEP